MWLLTAATFVFGSSAGSFLMRRREKDSQQLYVFAYIAGAAMLVGQATGADFDTMMLKHVPWATCAAMLLSAVSFQIRTRGQEGMTGWSCE